MIKKIGLIATLLIVVAHGYAQTFEGTVKWSMDLEITDPATKAKMAEAQKKMSDPANQARMKEMEAQMNDPQFKAMMEANPQVKAQMEAAMKMMQGGGDFNSIIPKGFILEMKGGNTLTKMEGGMMDKMEILYLKDKKQSYQLDRSAKTYSVLPTSNDQAEKGPEVKVTKTTEKTKILNYTCTKYIVETTLNGKPTTQVLWATTEIKDMDFKSLAQQRVANQQAFYADKVDGVPLKIEMTMPEGKVTIQVTTINRQTLSAANFAIPAGFKEVPMNIGFGR